MVSHRHRKKSNKKRYKIKPVRFSEDYYIQTTGGNAIYRGDEEVTVQINPQSFLRKRVEDLNTGELVVFNVYHTKTTLDDVEPYLYRSPLYNRAEGFVLEKNSRGVNIPKLRIALLHGLAKEGVISSDNLEARIMKEAPDFTRREYQDMACYVKQGLEFSSNETGVSVYIPQEHSIEFWLRGFTTEKGTSEIRTAPRDHNVFRLLQHEFGEEFATFVSNPDDMNGFYKNYRIRNVLRQQIMRTLNSWRGIHGEEKEEYESTSKINVSKEVALISSHFLKDITEQLKAVMVTDIKRVSTQGAYDLRRKDHLLTDGILRGEIDAIVGTGNMMGYPEIWEELEILEEYFRLSIMNAPIFQNIAPTGKLMFTRCALPTLLRAFGEKLDQEMLMIEQYNMQNRCFTGWVSSTGKVLDEDKDMRKGAIEVRDRFLTDIKNAILNEDLDNHYRFDKGTMARLMENYFRTRKTIPDRVFRYISECRTLAEESLKGIRIDIKKVGHIEQFRRTLERDYNLYFNAQGDNSSKGGLFFMQCLENAALLPPILNMIRPRLNYSSESPAEILYNVVKNDKEMLIGLVESLNKGVFFRTRDYTEKILKKYGLEQITNLRSMDFNILVDLEYLGIPFPKPPHYVYPKL